MGVIPAFILGLLLGGCVGIVVMAVMSINERKQPVVEIIEFRNKYQFLNDVSLCEVPRGWIHILINPMCEEIQAALTSHGHLDQYHVWQIKEKYGELRWYDDNSDFDYIQDIVSKYIELSKITCALCGRQTSPAKHMWDVPLCERCDRLRRK